MSQAIANAKSSAVAPMTSNTSRSTVAEMASYSICVLTVFLSCAGREAEEAWNRFVIKG
jgi:hypothetical protein